VGEIANKSAFASQHLGRWGRYFESLEDDDSCLDTIMKKSATALMICLYPWTATIPGIVPNDERGILFRDVQQQLLVLIEVAKVQDQ
jgi:hypothetical protein